MRATVDSPGVNRVREGDPGYIVRGYAPPTAGCVRLMTTFVVISHYTKGQLTHPLRGCISSHNIPRVALADSVDTWAIHSSPHSRAPELQRRLVFNVQH